MHLRISGKWWSFSLILHGLLTIRGQAINWTKVGLLLDGFLGNSDQNTQFFFHEYGFEKVTWININPRTDK